MKPFLNWAGGKRWLVAHHAEVLGDGRQRLVEPFVGSGVVFFHLEPAAALLADSNAQLIETYQAVRDMPDKVASALRRHHRLHSADHYYLTRDRVPRAAAARAARFIYLNRTCFNGLYRVNLRGKFNVPLGSKCSVVRGDDDFAEWSGRLQGVELFAQDFEATIERAGPGDLIYADPPYTVKHNMNNFVKYNERIFSWSDQERLAKCLSSASERGCRVLISNADHLSVQELYPRPVWTQLVLHRFSRLSGTSAGRKPATERLISNHHTTAGEVVEPRG